MKSMIAILFLLIFSNNIFAQTDTSFINLTHALIREYQQTGTIYYADKPYKDAISENYHYILSKNFTNRFNFNSDGKTILSFEEKKYIVNQLKNSKNHLLNDSLFPDSKRISSDTIMRIINDLNRVKFDSLTNKPIFFNNLYYSFFFTNPIYLKHKSIYVIYFLRFNGGGGGDELIFYKKENNKWIKWKKMELNAF